MEQKNLLVMMSKISTELDGKITALSNTVTANHREINSKVSILEGKVDRQREEIDEADLTSLKTDVKGNTDKIREIEQKLAGVENDKENGQEDNKKEGTQVNIDDRIQELREEDHRKKNLILYGIPEPRGASEKERKKVDMETVGKIVQEQLEVSMKEENITKCYRIGRRPENNEGVRRPRPVLMGLDSDGIKTQILRAARKLKDSEYSNVSIQHDLTHTQRDDMRKKIREAKSEEERDLSGDFIYRVRGPPGFLRIMKFKKKD